MGRNYRAQLTGVFGYPVDENPTVVMQQAAFKELGIDWRYLTILVKPSDLADAFRGLRAMNFAGINLTVPHKIEALKYVDEQALEVRLIGATNTVVNQNGRLIAYNTDGKGFVEGLRMNGVDLKGKRLAILGAGGASRAICVECALASAAELTLINRSVEKGEKLASLINEKTDCRASFIGWEGAIDVPPCDILINATSIGLYPDENCPDINYDSITPEMIVQDVIPNPADTLFLRRARERGAKTLDGLGMLVCQGAIGFKLWTGLDAPLDAMKRAIEAEQ
ncbi:MAG: shikimate dehydrogenase [Clostridia bacterium]|nr:shikimate dehydrogenase [Clostridia bacterium]